MTEYIGLRDVGCKWPIKRDQTDFGYTHFCNWLYNYKIEIRFG